MSRGYLRVFSGLVAGLVVASLLPISALARASSSAGTPLAAQAVGGNSYSSPVEQVDDNVMPGIPLTPGSVTGDLGTAGDYCDFYSVELAAGERVEFSLTGTGNGFGLRLYDTGAIVASTARTVYPRALFFDVATSGQYYLAVYTESGTGSYAVTWSRTGFSKPDLSLFVRPTCSTYPAMDTSIVATLVDPARVPGTTVYFEQRISGEATWTPAGRSVTDVSGRASVAVRPGGSTYYRARIVAEGGDLVSQEQFCSMIPTIGLVAPTTAARNTAFTVSGHFSPPRPAGEKTVRILCYLDGVLRRTFTATNGGAVTISGAKFREFSARVSLPEGGKWTILADLAATVLNEARQGGDTVWVDRPVLSIQSGGGWATYARSIHLTGRLVRSGKGLAYRTVKLQARYYNSAGSYSWTTVKYLKTDAAGRLSTYVKPRGSNYYRFSFAPEKGYGKTTPETRVDSCYASFNSSNDGVSERGPVYLTKGTHRITVHAMCAVYSIQVNSRSWSKTVTTAHIRKNTFKVLYVTVPANGSYWVGWAADGSGRDPYIISITVW
jgi:hypothetical protein